MAIVTITEAAELAGVSRDTLYNRLKEGALSRSGEGIDTSELLRVFGPLKGAVGREAPSPAAVTDVSEPAVDARSGVTAQPVDAPDSHLTTVLVTQLEAAERDRAWLRELVETERARVIERDERIHALTERITALLPAPEAATPRRSLWRRVLGA